MLSLRTKAVTGVVTALVFAYSLLIARQVLLGVVAASLVVLTGWLLSGGRESDVVRSFASAYWVAAFAVALALLAYSVVFQRTLFGVVWASLVLLGAVGVSYLRDRGYAPSMGFGRTLAVVALSLVVMAYSLLIARQALLGLFAVSLLAAVAWVTSPDGPFGGR